MTDLSGTTRLYGIVGYPVAHSLSPVMHSFAFRHYALDCVYVPFPVAPQDLASAVAGTVALGVYGFNVTIPHKETVMAFLDSTSAEAQFVGAVNTVLVCDGRTVGFNTDGEGFLQPLRALSLSFPDTSVCVLGAGGAARAITMALLSAGCPLLCISNRTYERGARLVGDLRQRFPKAEITVVPFERAAHAAGRSQLIVNTTSVGWHHDDGVLLPDACFRVGQVVYDIVYRPLDTRLLQAARGCGATVVPGVDMLIGQGAEAFRLWTGLTFPVVTIRQALLPFL